MTLDDLAQRIESGEVDHGDLADLMGRGMQALGLSVDRDKLVEQLRLLYPADDMLVAHMRLQLANYRAWCDRIGVEAHLLPNDGSGKANG